MSTKSAVPKPEDRREWLRIDERLLLDYRLLDESVGAAASDLPPVTKDMISALVNQPTADLLAREGEALEGSPLLPWISKIDWLLEMMLTSLATIHPGSVSIPRLTEVNISAGGLSFSSSRRFETDTILALRFIIPPFTPIQTHARVIRAVPEGRSQNEYKIAVEFTTLTADDQEHVIRHIIRTQADQLRARKAEHGG
jgi:PilZ domain